MLSVFAVLAAAVLFGTTGTAQALGPEGTTPLSVGVMRLVIGGTLLALVGLLLGRRRAQVHPNPRLRLSSFGLMALTGVCLAVYQPLFFLGTARNGVAVGTVVALGSAPVLAGLFEWMLTRRVPSRIWMAATALATVGVVLLSAGGGAASAGADPIGILGSVGAGASFAVFANAQRRLMDEGWDPFTVAGAMGAGSAVCGFLVLPFVDVSWLAEPSGLAMALWLGVATIALAYTLFTWGLERLTAATAATLTLAEPLTASILGIVVLGERLSAVALLGLVVLALGLALLAWGSRRPGGASVQDTPHPGRSTRRVLDTRRVDVREDHLSEEHTRALVSRHLAGMHRTSPPESVHALDVDGLRDPSVTFFSAWVDGELAGIGALKRLDAARGEVKSMRVDDRFLGLGVGRRILRHLVATARERGMSSLWLETGSTAEFDPARRLYESEGFVTCDPFPPYTPDPFSVFYTLPLTPSVQNTPQ